MVARKTKERGGWNAGDALEQNDINFRGRCDVRLNAFGAFWLNLMISLHILFDLHEGHEVHSTMAGAICSNAEQAQAKPKKGEPKDPNAPSKPKTTYQRVPEDARNRFREKHPLLGFFEKLFTSNAVCQVLPPTHTSPSTTIHPPPFTSSSISPIQLPHPHPPLGFGSILI